MKWLRLLILGVVTLVSVGCSFRVLDNGLAVDLIRDDGHEYTVLIPRSGQTLPSGENSRLPGIVFVVEPGSTDTSTVQSLKGSKSDELELILDLAHDKYVEACQVNANCVEGVPDVSLLMQGCAGSTQGGTFPPIEHPEEPSGGGSTTVEVCTCTLNEECDPGGVCTSTGEPSVECWEEQVATDE